LETLVARPGTKQARRVFQGSVSQRSLFSGADATEPAPSADESPPYTFVEFNAKSSEASYKELVPDEHRRRFGQHFTPASIARLMSHWIAAIRPPEILDPAVGTGILIRSAKELCPNAQFMGIDVDGLILKAANRSLYDVANVCLEQSDFLNWQVERRFPAMIANPPYLKHHNFNYDYDIFQAIGRRNHVRLSRLTNIYALFVFEICRRLTPGGRAAVIIPGEWANANFGKALKQFLVERGYLKALIYFSHEALVFDDALTTASVLLLENTSPTTTIATAYVQDNLPVEELLPIIAGKSVNHPGVVSQRLKTSELDCDDKWDQLLRGRRNEQQPGFFALSAIAETRRGIATGANDFFLLPHETTRRAQIRDNSLLPCVGKARDVIGFRFTDDDFNSLMSKDRPCRLVNLKGRLTRCEREYLARGEQAGYPKRYLLAARTPWYSMEQRKPAPIWAAVFGRRGLRFVWNKAGVHNLTAFHGIYPNGLSETQIKALVAALNSRLVQNLARQQQRVYGGGLRKYEPKDLLAIEVPELWKCGQPAVLRLADLLDQMDAAQRQFGVINEGLLSALDEAVAAAAKDALAQSQVANGAR
jgi:adenine-specific DNA-methyltransferase